MITTIASLIAQDVAICGFDASGGTTTAGDEFSFVLLRDFSAGEVIYFTEDEYTNVTDNFLFGEGHLSYTVPAGGLLENDVVRIRETGDNVFAVECATGTAVLVSGSGTWSYSSSDELYAYSASNSGTPWSSITEIHCFYYGSVILPPVDQDPSSDYPNMINLRINLGAGGPMNTDFQDASRVNTTLADFQNTSNWTKSTSDITLSCTNFTNHMLPVELVVFNAEEKNKAIYLNWTTASELNNEKFEIEGSQDGREFQKIGEVEGKGTTLEQQEYSFTDKNPRKGISYYRLKQIDFDGQFEYSKVISLNFKGENGEVGEFYPNPSKSGLVNLDYTSETDDEIAVSVFDVTGKLVVNQIQQISNGDNNLSFDFSELNTGIYIVKVGDERNPSLRKLIIE